MSFALPGPNGHVRSASTSSNGPNAIGNFRYPHIDDLRTDAAKDISTTAFNSVRFASSAKFNPYHNVLMLPQFESLLQQAHQCNQQVETGISFKRPDRAYIEFLKAENLVKLILQHRDYPYLQLEKKTRCTSVVKKHESQRSMVQTVEDAIRQSNRMHNDIPNTPPPSSSESTGVNGYSRPTTAPNHRRNPSEPPLYSTSLPRNQNDELYLDVESSAAAKPDANVDPLIQRFSQLRSPGRKPSYPTESSPSMAFPDHSRPTSKDGLVPISQMQSAPSVPEGKPASPRAMPRLPPNGPAPPPKIPLNPPRLDTALPRAPSPTYSPARNISAPSSIKPPRNTARSIATKVSREAGQVNGVSTANGYTNQYSAGSAKSFPELPDTTSISAQELYDRLRSYKILIIDIRPRDHYDEGHIWHKSIICVEPLSLQYGMSFEDLQERLIYSPEVEGDLFERMGSFDLVVYHDQNTRSDQFLDGSPKTAAAPWLRALYETLVTFNERVSLRRAPAVLAGGLDAWIDLVGPQALQSSKTLQVPNALPVPKPSRRMPHRPSITGGASSREIRMRRLHHYDPLDAKEKQEWQEKVKQEQVKPADLREFQAASEAAQEASGVDTSPSYHRTIDDFLRRFPEEPQVPTSMVRPVHDPRLMQSVAMPSVPSVLPRPAPAVSRPSYSGVSDRQALQASSTSRQLGSAQPPLWSPRLIGPSLKLPRTGLVNFGVTCYMNGTVQCLSATIDLATYFLDETWRMFVQRKNWKGSEGIMPEIFSNLIRSLWRGEAGALRPRSLRTFCARLNPEWGVDRQQDAKEFLEFLIDCLHEDLNVHWSRAALRPLTAEEELRREKMPMNVVSKIEWDRYSHREHSFIADLFAGQHASRLTCTNCHGTSTTYEAFYSISVEIPRSGQTRITECLQSYCKKEMLDPGEEWNCPVCKCQREATKTIRITRLPRILVVHFKRFSGSRTEATRKVHTAVDFPLYGLDMMPYMVDTRLKTGEQERPDPAVTPPFLYDAYAVMRHIGNTLNGGHYISLVRDAARGVWRRFDDDRVTDFEPGKMKFADRLQNEQAYIVFYERARAR